MMKKIIYIISLVCVFISCTDILDKRPLDLRTEEDIWTDANLAQAYLNSLCIAKNIRTDGYQIAETWFYMYNGPLGHSDFVSDNVFGRWKRAGNVLKSSAGIADATADIGAFDNFKDLRRVNLAIDNLLKEGRKETLGETIWEDMLGQAYFAKGLIYSTRARYFGGYPIIETALEQDDDLMLQRASLKDTYDYAIELLETAASYLNETAPAGRPAKGAALALLSEVCVHGAVYINNSEYGTGEDVTAYYNKAIQVVQDLDGLGVYSLEPEASFQKMFADFDYVSGGGASEVIFAQFSGSNIELQSDKVVEWMVWMPIFSQDLLKEEVQAKYNGNPFPGFTCPDSYGLCATPNPKVIDNTYYIIDLDGKARRWAESQKFQKYIDVTGSGDAAVYSLNAQALQDGYEDISELMYENRDKRFYHTIVHDGATYMGNTMHTRVGGNMHRDSYLVSDNQKGAQTGYLFRKNVDESRSWTKNDVAGGHKIGLRLSRAYLNAAEACFMKGDYPAAREWINKTRQYHGGLPALTSESGEELWQIYMDERNSELILEADRYYTLLRHGMRKGAENLDELNIGAIQQLEIAEDGKSYRYTVPASDADVNTYSWLRHRFLFPVPQAVREQNPNYSQNPRY